MWNSLRIAIICLFLCFLCGYKKELLDWNLQKVPNINAEVIEIGSLDVSIKFQIEESEVPLKRVAACWSEQPGASLDNSVKEFLTIAGEQTGSLDNLCELRKYHIRVYAENDAGGTYSNELIVETDGIDLSDQLIIDFMAEDVEIMAGVPVTFTNLSILPGCGTIERWEWDFGNGLFSNEASPTVTFDVSGSYSIQLTALTTLGEQLSVLKENYITVISIPYSEGTVHCLSGGVPTAVVEVLNPTTGRVWMDRNLGASQVATSSNDQSAYGDLFQWGRFGDGHQCRNSPTTGLQSTDPIAEHGSFIIENSNWLNSINNYLWQGVTGINTPCPDGFRLPTGTELNQELQSWADENNTTGAFGSPLKLPAAGFRNAVNGVLSSVGTSGFYWTSNVSGSNANRLIISTDDASIVSQNRARGYSVRCIRD